MIASKFRAILAFVPVLILLAGTVIVIYSSDYLGIFGAVVAAIGALWLGFVLGPSGPVLALLLGRRAVDQLRLESTSGLKRVGLSLMIAGVILCSIQFVAGRAGVLNFYLSVSAVGILFLGAAMFIGVAVVVFIKRVAKIFGGGS